MVKKKEEGPHSFIMCLTQNCRFAVVKYFENTACTSVRKRRNKLLTLGFFIVDITAFCSRLSIDASSFFIESVDSVVYYLYKLYCYQCSQQLKNDILKLVV